MTVELKYLTWVTALTAFMWVPYILNMIMVRGLIDAVGYPENPASLAPWAARMKKAHYNAIENLVVFASLVIVAHLTGVNNETTALACNIYFWSRLIHFAVYTLAIPWLRTLAFVVGFACQVSLAAQILI